MKPILQNLVEMTGHRDHLRLEVSVLTTLQAFSGMVQVRSLEVFMLDGEYYCRPRTWMDGRGQWLSAGTEAQSDPQRVRVADMPALHECLQAHASQAVAKLGKGRHALWLPVWMNDKVHTCLEVIQARPFSAQKIDTINSVFQVFQNYQSLLDYSERDALTGLLNRKTFDEQFARHAASAALARRESAAKPKWRARDDWTLARSRISPSMAELSTTSCEISSMVRPSRSSASRWCSAPMTTPEPFRNCSSDARMRSASKRKSGQSGSCQFQRMMDKTPFYQSRYSMIMIDKAIANQLSGG